ncbi:hypothetical protein [Micromonospora musae]|uniref:hypothetical protein n=1 Tax=Micromonospora musae TaxID=1894970 RepID=UPI0018F46119|nr:hypothetical protein [Micromonospora musae]
MVVEQQRYRYVGPADIAVVALQGDEGRLIRSAEEFADWVASVDARELAEPFTYVVDTAGVLRLAARRSEHVACAGGGTVLAAGEIALVRRPDGWSVSEVSNQSTGYCPEPRCWPAVAAALKQVGLENPGGFTCEFVFRRCPDCKELSVVKDGDFICYVCGSDLPQAWNVDQT